MIGIFYGMFALAMGAPNFKNIAEGRMNGYQAIQVIERMPEIPINDPEGEEFGSRFKGEIQFKNVVFWYAKSKEDVLRKVSFTMEKGKTTAIVGASGSGKSTIV